MYGIIIHRIMKLILLKSGDNNEYGSKKSNN